jgi:hypothetical protein
VGFFGFPAAANTVSVSTRGACNAVQSVAEEHFLCQLYLMLVLKSLLAKDEPALYKDPVRTA